MFWHADKFLPKPKPEESTAGAKEQQAWLHTTQCLHIIPGKFFDGCGQSCIQLATAALCSWCSSQSEAHQKVSLLPISWLSTYILQPQAVSTSASQALLKWKRNSSGAGSGSLECSTELPVKVDFSPP